MHAVVGVQANQAYSVDDTLPGPSIKTSMSVERQLEVSSDMVQA